MGLPDCGQCTPGIQARWIIGHSCQSCSSLQLEQPMSAIAMLSNDRYVCMGCQSGDASGGYFDTYKAAACHYSRSKPCQQSGSAIKYIQVQSNLKAWRQPPPTGTRGVLAQPDHGSHSGPAFGKVVYSILYHKRSSDISHLSTGITHLCDMALWYGPVNTGIYPRSTQYITGKIDIYHKKPWCTTSQQQVKTPNTMVYTMVYAKHMIYTMVYIKKNRDIPHPNNRSKRYVIYHVICNVWYTTVYHTFFWYIPWYIPCDLAFWYIPFNGIYQLV